MANFNSLKATIDAQIKANGVQAITGPILNAVLTAMINTIGNGYSLQGSVAQTTDNPGAPDNPVAYLAAGPGTYTNFGATVIPDDGHAYLLTWDTSWHAVQLPLPTFDLANGKQDALTFDDAPTPGSDNPVKSSGIAEALDDKQNKDTGDTAGHVAVMDGDGNAVDGGAALADLATKEDVEAVEQEVAVVAGEAGLAEAVIDTDNAGTEQEFTFRKSGGDGGAYYRKIKGKTLVANQLVERVYAASEIYGITRTEVSNICLHFQGTSTNSTDYIAGFLSVIAGHKYYYATKGIPVTCGIYNAVNIGKDAIIVTALSTDTQVLSVYIPSGVYIDADVYVQAVDLTLRYGSEIDGMTDEQIIAKYESENLTPLPYTPGTLISNDAEAVETTGANQWDEVAEVVGSQLQSKNLIPVFPNTAYYITMLSYPSHYHNKIFYNAEGEEIGLDSSGAQSFITPADCAYMRFVLNSGYGTTYNHDICINLSNPAINGQYFPYWKRTLQLDITTKEDTDGNVPFPNGLQSCPVAQDEATKEGGIIRVGIRAYQAGDESDADVITDGTNTNYALTTPVPFTWAEPLNLGVKVDENGTERAVAPEGATAPSAPFVADTTYTMSIARMVAILQGI